jgi:hypothetical protein
MREIGLIILALLISKWVFTIPTKVIALVKPGKVHLMTYIIWGIISIYVTYQFLIAKHIVHWKIGSVLAVLFMIQYIITDGVLNERY